MFTAIDLELPVVIGGLHLTLILQRQEERTRWALCSERWGWWSGWAALC